jgi:hypothetical protein
MFRGNPSASFAIEVGTSASLLIFVLFFFFLKAAFPHPHPKKLKDNVRARSWGQGRYLGLPKVSINSLPRTPYTSAAHSKYTRDGKIDVANPAIPFPALILIHSLFFFFFKTKCNYLTVSLGCTLGLSLLSTQLCSQL